MQPATEKRPPEWPFIILVPVPGEGTPDRRKPYHPFNVYRKKASAEAALKELGDKEAVIDRVKWAEQMIVVDDN